MPDWISSHLCREEIRVHQKSETDKKRNQPDEISVMISVTVSRSGHTRDKKHQTNAHRERDQACEFLAFAAATPGALVRLPHVFHCHIPSGSLSFADSPNCFAFVVRFPFAAPLDRPQGDGYRRKESDASDS